MQFFTNNTIPFCGRKETAVLYRDPLYGSVLIPKPLAALFRTKEMVRLRNITQSVLPNCLLVDGPVPSRFQHSVGVMMLASRVLERNRFPQEDVLALLAASLLHDTGNACLSHLSEHFLEELTGKNGESFLEDILDGSETAAALKEIGVAPERIVRLVTGEEKPFSDVLHGSLDIDNLDNVNRYNAATRAGAPPFNAQAIADSFRFTVNGWTLLAAIKGETEKWQAARAAVYSAIYHARHLAPAMMVYRALEIAFLRNEIAKEFFFLDDERAVAFLAERTNQKSAALVERALRWDWYEETATLAWTDDPPARIRELAAHWEGRRAVAETVMRALNLSEEAVCVYVGQGRDKRKIHLPFTGEDGAVTADESDETPIYRLKVYLPPECAWQRERAVEAVRAFIA